LSSKNLRAFRGRTVLLINDLRAFRGRTASPHNNMRTFRRRTGLVNLRRVVLFVSRRWVYYDEAAGTVSEVVCGDCDALCFGIVHVSAHSSVHHSTVQCSRGEDSQNDASAVL
jgi:hypothetical protein